MCRKCEICDGPIEHGICLDCGLLADDYIPEEDISEEDDLADEDDPDRTDTNFLKPSFN